MSNQQALLLFLRALLAAKKSLALYPPASEAATGWIERLRRSLDDAFRQGLIFPIRVGRDRFSWPGGEVAVTDQALKGLRFEMQSRGILELSIEPSVEHWELRAMLELLNKPVEQFASLTAARNYLRDRAVVHVSVSAPGLGGLPATPGSLDLGWGTGTDESGSGAMLPGADADALDLLVESILKSIDARLEYPWEEGKRQRLLEAITLTLERDADPGASPAGPSLLSHSDPLLLELRQEIMDACRPEVLLARSADVLLALVSSSHRAESPEFAFDALAEIAREALAGGQPDLALRVLRSVATDATPEASQNPPTPTTLFRGKVAGHSHVSLIVDLLRRDPPTGPMDIATEYLRLAGPEGMEVFTALLAEQPHRRIRIRMCEVLARLGVPAIPSLLSRLDDKRWFAVRNALYTLRKIGHASAFPAIVAVLEHPHPRVRLEAMRAAIHVGGAAARAPLLRRVHDPDTSVQRTAIGAVSTPGNDAAVPELRKVLLGPGARSEDDAEVQLETIRALASIATPAALEVLEATVSRRPWFWKRADRRVRDLAVQTLDGRKPLASVSP